MVVLSEKKYKAGYIVREEAHKTNFEVIGEHDGGFDEELQPLIEAITSKDTVIVKSAYTLDGKYIGDDKTAYRLCKKWGIKPDLSSPDNNVCSIGFCEVNQKWYGWSHRAICGFSIGDVVEEGDCTNSSGYIESYIKEHPEKDRSLPVGFTAKTLDDCKRMAIAYADSVS